MRIVLFILTWAFTISCWAQVEKVEFELEKTSLKINFNAGLYRSRLPNTISPASSFLQPGFFAQVYFPFKRSLDTPSNFHMDKADSNFYDRLFTASPIAVFHLTNMGGNAVGLGQEISFKIANKTFIKSQLAVVWVESNSQKNDGLKAGLNFHHYWYLAHYLNKKNALLVGYNHISNGKILSREIGSLFDMFTIGWSHHFAN